MKRSALILICLLTLAFTGIGARGGENPFGTTVIPRKYVYDQYTEGRVTNVEGGGGGSGRFTSQPVISEDPWLINTTTRSNREFEGEVALGSVGVTGNFALDTTTSVVTGSLRVDALHNSVDTPGGGSPIAGATFTLEVEFEIIDEPAMIQLFGMMSAQSEGVTQVNGSVTLTGLGPGDNVELTIESPSLVEMVPIQETRLLVPGNYRLFVDFRLGDEVHAGPFNPKGLTLSHSSTVVLDLDVMVMPTDIDELVWTAGNSNFDIDANWEPMRVPTGGDTARFHDSDVSPVDVTFGTALSERAVITDDVRFLSGTYTLGEGSETEPSLVITRESNESGSLALIGHQLNCGFAAIAEEVGTEGDIGLLNGGHLNCSNRLTVGESGTGRLDIGIEGQGKVMTGEFRIGENAQSTGLVDVSDAASSAEIELTAAVASVGYFGTGTLIINDAQIETGPTSIGRFFGANGKVEVKGDNAKAEWTFGGDLIVGDHGEGDLTVSKGTVQALAEDDIAVGQGDGSSGILSVMGPDSVVTTFAGIEIGLEGDGQMSVTGGADVAVGSSLRVGGINPTTGGGSLKVEGSADTPAGIKHSEVQVDVLAVGREGNGDLKVKDGGRILGNSNALFGSSTGGDADISIEFGGIVEMTENVDIGQISPPLPGFARGRAEITMTGSSSNRAFLIGSRIFLAAGSHVVGSGCVLRAHNGFDNEGGTVTSGVLVDAPPKQTTMVEPFEIEGDYTMTSGTLEIGASGLALGEYGIYEVTGEANIQNATVHFVFQDGFLPKTDDELPFFMAQGALTVGTLAFTYEGAAPGFQFNVMEENGMLVFKAMNDAQPDGEEPTPRPTAINSATDINGDRVIDANDLLEVLKNLGHVVVE